MENFKWKNEKNIIFAFMFWKLEKFGKKSISFKYNNLY